MQKSLVFTFLADDKPGIVELLATAVKDANGNWLESNLAHMSGKFAGIVRVIVSEAKEQQLANTLAKLEQHGIKVTIDNCNQAENTKLNHGKLNVIGNDRPGIVQEITKALASHDINIEQLQSHVSSAPMAGTPLFEANISFSISTRTNAEALKDALDEIAENLDVDIALDWLENNHR